MTAILETRALRKYFRHNWTMRRMVALDGLDLSVRAGRDPRPYRSERRRQDDDLQSRARPPAGQRRDGVVPRRTAHHRGPRRHRLPARAAVLLRLPDRRGDADHVRSALRTARPGAAPARRRDHRAGATRPQAPRGAALAVQGHAAARRHRPGAAQRSAAAHPRRADVGSRPDRPARHARADPRPPRRRHDGHLLLAHPARCRSALRPRRDPHARRAARGDRPARRRQRDTSTSSR